MAREVGGAKSMAAFSTRITRQQQQQQHAGNTVGWQQKPKHLPQTQAIKRDRWLTHSNDQTVHLNWVPNGFVRSNQLNPYDPIKRNRRRSRLQRTAFHSDLWPERLKTKLNISMKFNSTDAFNEAFADNANSIAFAFNAKPDKASPIKLSFNGSESPMNAKSKNAKAIYHNSTETNVIEAPFATSISVGKIEKIVVTSSRTISTSTEKSHGNHSLGISNAINKHDSIYLNQVHSTIASKKQWNNKYNIDYDNRLEDEYEIIAKDD